jgi:preprotein translocase subunit YajC
MQNFRVYLNADFTGQLEDGVVVGGEQSAPADANASGNADVGTSTGTPVQTGAVPQPTLLESILPMIIMVPIMIGAYWLMTRSQRKRDKQMKEMQASIKPGDNVITAGGFFGRVVSVGEDCYNVEFGTNRSVHIPVLKTDILGIRSPKMTPAPKQIEGK